MPKLFTEDETRAVAEAYARLYVSDEEPLDDDRAEEYRRDKFQQAVNETTRSAFHAQQCIEHQEG